MNKNKKTSKSRRKFVKTTTTTTAGLLAMSSPLRGMVHLGVDPILKVALVGCGGRGAGATVQALTADKNVELIAVADVFQDRIDGALDAINTHFNGEKTIEVPANRQFTGFNAYKNAIDLSDVVILTSTPGFRPYHFEYAIQNDKHVFMEKPIATDPNGIRKVLEVGKKAKKKKLNVVVGLQRHYQRKYLHLFQKLQDGLIGKIVAGQIYWNSSGVWVNERKPSQTELEYQMRNWYYFNWLCGDHIVEQHIHNIDVANWFVRDYPITAQGMGGREVRKGKDNGEIFDHHFVEFTYPDGTIISSQCRHIPGCMDRVDEAFQGTKGSIAVGEGKLRDLNGNLLYQYEDEEDPNPYQVEHDVLFKSIRKGGVISDVENAAMSNMAAIIGRMATYSGDIIEMEKALALDLQLVPEEMNWDSKPPVLPDDDGNYKIPVPGQTSYF